LSCFLIIHFGIELGSPSAYFRQKTGFKRILKLSISEPVLPDHGGDKLE
jgi:hypothetical protein